MLRFLADENFHNGILNALRREQPDLDVVRAQDYVPGSADPVLLGWAAEEGRIILTHDVKTVPRFAYDRVRQGEPMAGVIVINTNVPPRNAVADLSLLIACITVEECRDRVQFLPL